MFMLKDRNIRLYSVVSTVVKDIPYKEQYLKGDPTPSPIIETTSSTYVELLEVKTISFDFEHDLGIEQGLTQTFFQPWYIKPGVIKITGSSYMGNLNLIPSQADQDASRLFALFSTHFREIYGSKNKIKLEVVNNPENADIYTGYITSYNFEENVNKPFMLDYTIDFKGKPTYDESKLKGVLGAQYDFAKVQ